MTRYTHLLGALGFVVTSAGAGIPQEKPRIIPVFHAATADPTFLVECVNDTGRTQPSNSDRWAWAPAHLRIDGKPHVNDGAMIGPGSSTEVAPGATWRGLVTLNQERRTFAPAVAFGAQVRGGPIVPLAPGRHSVAFRCGETWSDDYVFYWERR